MWPSVGTLMAGQLGFEFTRPSVPSLASVELAATRARATQPSPVADPQPDAELAHALELALRARFGEGPAALRLTITDNRRTMVSLRKEKAPELLEVRLHHMFLQAAPEVWSALGDYLFSGDRDAASCIARFIESHREHIRRPERRALALSSAGKHHNLSEICQAINQRYFDGQAAVSITWAREQAGRPSATRRSIKLGSYTSRDRLIRVHPALDAAFVPRYFVEYIVFHELLHHILPPKKQGSRRELHGPAFLARERTFEHYEAALRWERENLRKLLRGRRARARARAARLPVVER